MDGQVNTIPFCVNVNAARMLSTSTVEVKESQISVVMVHFQSPRRWVATLVGIFLDVPAYHKPSQSVRRKPVRNARVSHDSMFASVLEGLTETIGRRKWARFGTSLASIAIVETEERLGPVFTVSWDEPAPEV